LLRNPGYVEYPLMKQRISLIRWFLTILSVGVIAAGCEDDSLDLPLDTSKIPTTQPEIPPLIEESFEKVHIPKAPHGGKIIVIQERLGVIECLFQSGQVKVYFLDMKGKPLEGIIHPVLTITTSRGPERLQFHDCDEADFSGACGVISGDLLKEYPSSGIIRFELNGEPYRILLTSPITSTQPAAKESVNGRI